MCLRSQLKHACWRAAPCTALLSRWHLSHNHSHYYHAAAARSIIRRYKMTSLNSDLEQPIILHEYSNILQGTLHKRYKRFLADVDFAHDSTAAAAAAGRAAGAGVADKSATIETAAGADISSSSSKRRRRSNTAASCTEAAVAASAAVAQQSSVLTVVHCPNTGSMAGLLDSLPAPAACSVSNVATRKYRHTLESICLHGPKGPVWVGVHSVLANKLAAGMLKQQLLPELGQYTAVQSEVKLGGSSSTRFDFMLSRQDGRKVYVEVKSVTMAMSYADWSSSTTSNSSSSGKRSIKNLKSRKRPAAESGQLTESAGAAATATTAGNASASAASTVVQVPAAAAAAAGGGGGGGAAAAAVVVGASEAPGAAASTVVQPPDTLVSVFPDAVSERAQRHVQDLMQLKAAGNDAVCLFVIQRNDCSCLAPAAHIDPIYAATLKAAHAAGVQMLAVLCEFVPEQSSIVFKGSVPVIMD